MEYHNLVADFARRTQHNLHAIRTLNAGTGQGAYEVTALINSMLGLLVFPQQAFCDQIPELPLGTMKANGWPLPQVAAEYSDVDNLRTLIRYVRNAISHFHIKFLTDSTDQISGLTIWNEDRFGNKSWEGHFSLGELESFSNKFVDLLIC